jgi:hypothetical protein
MTNAYVFLDFINHLFIDFIYNDGWQGEKPLCDWSVQSYDLNNATNII